MLPAIYRYQDEQRGNPLKAYLAVLEETYQSLEEGLEKLYENCFIETCEPWVIPYIGELVGFKLHADDKDSLASLRPLVANALANRRRKGSLPGLEKLLAQTTGWGICIKEGTHGPAITQHITAPTRTKQGTVSLRGSEIAWLGSPFEESARTVDIRSSDSERDNSGGGSPFSLKINIWRIKGYQVSGVRPRHISGQPHSFSFCPTGRDIPLYKMPIPWEDPNWPGDIGTVPGPLLMDPLVAASEWYRTQLAQGKHFDRETLERRQHFKIFVEGKLVPSEEIIFKDLSTPANISPISRSYRTGDGGSRRFRNRIAVDPHLGRMLFTEPMLADNVSIQYTYGAVSNLGAGPYNRRTTLCPLSEVGAFVSHKRPGKKPSQPYYPSLEAALTGWANKKFEGPIRIMDSGSYAFPANPIFMEGDRKLVIEAANGRRPFICEDLKMKGIGAGSSLALYGLLIDGSIRVESEGDGQMEMVLTHTTLVPQPDRDSIFGGGATGIFALDISAESCIMGSIFAEKGVLLLQMKDSIVDGSIGNKSTEKNSPAYMVGSFTRTTVLGTTALRKLTKAIDSLFVGPVSIRQREDGLIRYSFFPKGSQTPPTYRCIHEWQDGKHIQPVFSSTRYGDPAYGRLEHDCAMELLTGSENGSEMGVWQSIKQVGKMNNLQTMIAEYLPFGLVPALQFVT